MNRRRFITQTAIAATAAIVVAPSVAVAAQKHRLPSISILKAYAHVGLLMSYGPIQESYYPRTAAFADRILKGAKPGELPIEGSDRFELVINLKIGPLDRPVDSAAAQASSACHRTAR